MSGCCAKSILNSVPLPTPEGPEMTIGRRSEGRSGAMVRALVLLWARVKGEENGLVACALRQILGSRDERAGLTIVRATRGNMSKMLSQGGS